MSNQVSQHIDEQIIDPKFGQINPQSTNYQLNNKVVDKQSKQLFNQYLSNLSAESILLSAIKSLLTQRSNILDQILTLEGIGPFKVNGRVFTIIKRYGKCHERELKDREIKIVA